MSKGFQFSLVGAQVAPADVSLPPVTAAEHVPPWRRVDYVSSLCLGIVKARAKRAYGAARFTVVRVVHRFRERRARVARHVVTTRSSSAGGGSSGRPRRSDDPELPLVAFAGGCPR